jgi:hypothetical protein
MKARKINKRIEKKYIYAAFTRNPNIVVRFESLTVGTVIESNEQDNFDLKIGTKNTNYFPYTNIYCWKILPNYESEKT